MRSTLTASRCLVLAGLLLIPLSMTSCGDDTNQSGATFSPVDRKTQGVAADAGRLIPEKAAVVGRVRKLGALINKTKAVADMFEPGSGRYVDIAGILAMAGLDTKSVDMTGSPLFALGLTEAGQSPQFIVPVKDGDAAIGSAKMPSALSGGYLGLGLGAKPVVGSSTPAIADALPLADCAIRVDLKALLTMYRPMIEPYLDPETLADLDPGIKSDPAVFGMVEMMTNATKKVMDNARRLDVAVSLDGGALDLDCVFELAGERDNPPSGSSMMIAQMLPMTDATIYMAFEHDWAEFADAFMPMYDQMAKGLEAKQKQDFLDVIRSAKDLYADVKGGGAFAIDLTPQGMQGVGIMECANPGKYLNDYMSYIGRYAKVVEPLPAAFKIVEFKSHPNVMVDGVEFRGLNMTFDMASMMKSSGGPELPAKQMKEMASAFDSLLGKGGIPMLLAAHEKLLLTTFGNDDTYAARLVESVKKGQKHRSALIEQAMTRLHDRPSMFFGMDLRRLARQMHSFIDGATPMTIPAVPEGDPVILWMSFALTRKGYALQAHVDLGGIAELVKAMTPR